MYKKILLPFLLLSTLIFAQLKQPTFNLKTVDGKTFIVKGAKNGIEMPKELKNRIILLEFWGVHCPPCRISIPHYIELNKKYKDKIAMFAVEVQMTPRDALQKFVKDNGINYNVLTQKDNYDFVNYISARAGWRGSIPFILIFDKTGEIKFVKIGYLSKEQVEGVIKILLQSEKNSSKDTNSTQSSNDINKSK